MAKASIEVIQALRNTAQALQKSHEYQWGHMGSCNCGHLAQEITKLSKSAIHSRAMHKHGDWNEQLNDYCPTSGFLMDDLITQILDYGFNTADLKHLEKLSDPVILQALPPNKNLLCHNKKHDVILYINTWASILEKKIIRRLELSEICASNSVPNTV